MIVGLSDNLLFLKPDKIFVCLVHDHVTSFAVLEIYNVRYSIYQGLVMGG